MQHKAQTWPNQRAAGAHNRAITSSAKLGTAPNQALEQESSQVNSYPLEAPFLQHNYYNTLCTHLKFKVLCKGDNPRAVKVPSA